MQHSVLLTYNASNVMILSLFRQSHIVSYFLIKSYLNRPESKNSHQDIVFYLFYVFLPVNEAQDSQDGL